MLPRAVRYSLHPVLRGLQMSQIIAEGKLLHNNWTNHAVDVLSEDGIFRDNKSHTIDITIKTEMKFRFCKMLHSYQLNSETSNA
jgi:hypothetical protein